jgi:endonuclease G, mitochondrial
MAWLVRTIIPIAVALFVSAAHAAQPDSLGACAEQIPLGAPVVTAPGSYAPICRRGYAVLHDNDRREPLWVSYVLTADHAVGCGKRKDKFRPDPDLPSSVRAALSDYAASGYDRGHLAPNDDFDYDPDIAAQSFYLSNMVPQLHAVNAGTWYLLERAARAWATQRGVMLVMAGPIFDPRLSGTIGRNRLPIPSAFWKVVVDRAAGSAVAFIMPNVDPGVGYTLAQFQVTIGEVERRASVRLPLDIDRAAKPAIWPADFSRWTRMKNSMCRDGAFGGP